MKLLHLLSFALFIASIHSDVVAADGPAPVAASADAKPSVTTTAVSSGMLDADVPIERRRELAASLESAILPGADPAALYLLGSLYRVGEDNPA